jgi:hypothetical protein
MPGRRYPRTVTPVLPSVSTWRRRFDLRPPDRGDGRLKCSVMGDFSGLERVKLEDHV